MCKGPCGPPGLQVAGHAHRRPHLQGRVPLGLGEVLAGRGRLLALQDTDTACPLPFPLSPGRAPAPILLPMKCPTAWSTGRAGGKRERQKCCWVCNPSAAAQCARGLGYRGPGWGPVLPSWPGNWGSHTTTHSPSDTSPGKDWAQVLSSCQPREALWDPTLSPLGLESPLASPRGDILGRQRPEKLQMSYPAHPHVASTCPS